MGHLIEFRDVGMDFPADDGSTRTVLDGINLRIRQGEIVAVVGPSGCGKSTLLRLLYGKLYPTRGEVLVDGEPVTGIGPDRAMVTQGSEIFPHLTVLDNITAGPVWRNTSLLNAWNLRKKARVRREAQVVARELMESLELQPRDEGLYRFELSGGMRQRVCIAQSIINNAKVLLMDESSASLDPNTKEKMQLLLLEQWKKYNLTIFFVTHDLTEALFLGTRIIVLTQHWTDGISDVLRPARIVMDKVPIGGHPKPVNVKFSPEFTAMREAIHANTMDPNLRLHVSRFELDHADAIREGVGFENTVKV